MSRDLNKVSTKITDVRNVRADQMESSFYDADKSKDTVRSLKEVIWRRDYFDEYIKGREVDIVSILDKIVVIHQSVPGNYCFFGGILDNIS